MPQERDTPAVTLLQRGVLQASALEEKQVEGTLRGRGEGHGRGAKGGRDKGRREEEDEGPPKKELQASPTAAGSAVSSMEPQERPVSEEKAPMSKFLDRVLKKKANPQKAEATMGHGPDKQKEEAARAQGLTGEEIEEVFDLEALGFDFYQALHAFAAHRNKEVAANILLESEEPVGSQLPVPVQLRPLPPAFSGPQLNESQLGFSTLDFQKVQKGQSTSPSIPAPSASAAEPGGEGQWNKEEERRLLQSMGWDSDEHDEGGLKESEINAARESLIGRLQAEGDGETFRDRAQREFDTWSDQTNGSKLRRVQVLETPPPSPPQQNRLRRVKDTPRASSGLQVNEAFPVGSELVVLEAAIMRESQELRSKALAQLEKDRRLQVLGYGQGIRSRRLYVHDLTSGQNGWISFSSQDGNQLVAPTKASPNEVQKEEQIQQTQPETEQAYFVDNREFKAEFSTFGKKSKFDGEEHRKPGKKSRRSRRSQRP